MTTTINASTSAGLVQTADTSGSLALQTASTTALTLDTSQNATFAGSVKTNTLTSAASTALTLQSAGTTAITVDTSQNVGVGLTSPSQKLDVSGSAQLSYNGGSNYLYFQSTNNYVGRNGSTGDIWLNTVGAQNTIFGIGGTEKMRITSAGDLVVGKTASGIGTQGFAAYSTGEIEANAGSNPAAYFNRTNDGTIMQFRRASTTVGTISVSTGATAYNTSSDYRLKENIAPMTGALAKVAQLKPVIYKWKADGSDGEGFIAHELAEVCPLAVHGEKDAVDENGKIVPQGIDTSFLVATLTAAIQEQQTTITAQAETINALTARIVALEK